MRGVFPTPNEAIGLPRGTSLAAGLAPTGGFTD